MNLNPSEAKGHCERYGPRKSWMPSPSASICLLLGCVLAGPKVAASGIPSHPPRVFITTANREQFRKYCLAGEGQALFSLLREEFDQKAASAPFPAEPESFGDSDPLKRDSDKVDKWRDAQAACNVASGTAEAAVILWIVTEEPRYLTKAKQFLLAACQWNPRGTTGIDYNDEAHFRLWRRLPFAYDQLRGELTEAERKQVLDSFRRRGSDSFRLVAREITDVRRNSIEREVASHGVRFVSMTGIAGLALYDDLPEAKEWLDRALHFYREQFTPWGGADGGWGEGAAYWRGNIEHGRFQEALDVLDHPEAWQNPFWKQTGYFPLYFVQPYPTTQFGDTPSAGKLSLEPQMANFLMRLAREFNDGYLRTYAELADPVALLRQGLNFTRPNYPSGMEYLLRNFVGSQEPLPVSKSLSQLPQVRWFRDVGWVSFHSALGMPGEDIMLSFKSSPYASYSHSHADQNAFILNAFGESLAINAGFREFHRSPHHTGYTRQTLSKNAVLIGGRGQLAQSEEARGRITRFKVTDRFAWTTGDATDAYKAGPLDSPVKRAMRDVIFVDSRYFVLRDVIELKRSATVSWLLHADRTIDWDPNGEAVIRQKDAGLHVRLLSPSTSLEGSVSDQFPVAFDAKYASQTYTNQSHLTATTSTPRKSHVIYAVLWPSRGGLMEKVQVKLKGRNLLSIRRPDGKTDELVIKRERVLIK